MTPSSPAPVPDGAARLDAALRAARDAGDLALRAFRTRTFDTDFKTDGSPVTAADRGAELLARDMLLKAFPDDGFLGEEFGEVPGRSGIRWIVDPIDGTTSFTRGVPLWGTMIGLECGGRTVLGVIDFPALGSRLYAAQGGGAWHEPEPGVPPVRAAVSETSRLGDALWLTTSHDYFRRAGREAEYGRLLRAVGSSRGWSDCYAVLLLATGRADAVVEPLVKPWDLAAIVPIIEEAGGRFSDFAGTPSIHSGNCLATNGQLHGDLLAVIQGQPGHGGSDSSAILLA